MMSLNTWLNIFTSFIWPFIWPLIRRGENRCFFLFFLCICLFVSSILINRSDLFFVIYSLLKRTMLYHHNLLTDHNNTIDPYWLLHFINYLFSILSKLIKQKWLLNILSCTSLYLLIYVCISIFFSLGKQMDRSLFIHIC